MNTITTYSFKWKQPYLAWETFATNNIESLLNISDFKEANELIKRIKNGNFGKT